ncbi:coproporphyrinogen III oxidase family protein [Sulfurimonas sp. SAG-AH-194-C21]|nr:radical SAM family heme chaperone HemW [Sulfurimonas sp. SAG-AH-194-C21]MDF1883558.1 coproporphyrinogen III oxidase family protein [Sulfurimonas sp. SAG-AH-194-C21]
MLLYIHIPFCDSKCSYCAFNSYVDKFHLKEKYMVSLFIQLKHELKRFNAQKESIETIFIGGGTPSTVAPELYKDIFTFLKPYLQKNIEITSEANPNSASYEWLEGMYELGVNRISFGVQSFDETKLKVLNRAHSPQMAKDAIKNAKEIGFKNLSLDLIYATLGDTKELILHDINIAFTLPINHISAYALTIGEGTAFEHKPQMSSEQLEITSWIFDTIKDKGLPQYEISNFGEYQSSHNLGYWKYTDYMGVGAGAVGKLDLTRFYPNPDIEEYILNPCVMREESLTSEDKKIEQYFLGMRSCVGIYADLFTSQERKQADILVQENKLDFIDNTFYNKDFLLADEITLFLTA